VPIHLYLALEGGGCAAIRSCRFTPRKEPGNSCTAVRMGLEFGLEVSIPGRSSPLLVAIPNVLVLIVHIRIGHVRIRQRLEDCFVLCFVDCTSCTIIFCK